jgi:SAM-dependent methyltransferase
LEWSGERLTTAVGGQIEIEHLHRYIMARDFCRKLDVLDVASGEGYGTALLAQVAKSAIGIDISAEAADHAASQYRSPNLRYLQGDARKIPLADESVDIVTSFETIEHFYEQDEFLAEVRRVLRPGGRLIVSSPDRDIYSPPGGIANPYHKRELSRSEFETLLGCYFSHIRLVCQRPMLGSVLLTDDGEPGPTVTIERRGAKYFERSDGMSRSPYLVAVASDATLPPMPNSIYIDESEIGPLISRAAEHEAIKTALAEALHRADSAETAFHASRAEIAKCMCEANTLKVEHQAIKTALAETLKAEHEAIKTALAEALHRADSAEAALHASRAELRQACMHRDAARLALRRARVFAENAWKSRLVATEAQIDGLTRRALEAEASAHEWNARYHTLLRRLERFLFRSGLFRASRLVPRSLRHLARDRLFSARGS